MAPALAIGQFVDAHNGAVNAIAAIVIATFTIVLAVRTGSLFKATAGLESAAPKQSADMAESFAHFRDSR
jgi:Na+/proline symporter